MSRKLYQAVEDRSNPDDVEAHGPYKCERKNAWLGYGYYFWDTFIWLAHWWGKNCYPTNGYMICQSTISEDKMVEVYDLVGRPELMLEIECIVKIISDNTGCKSIYMAEILEYLKKRTSFLYRYKAIRAYPLETMNASKSNGLRIKFTSKNRAFIDTCPEIQFCILDKNILNDDYHIVYPDEYCNGIVV